MIRINLINDVSALASKQKHSGSKLKFDFNMTSIFASKAANIAADETGSFLVRIVALVLPVILLFGYNRYASYVSEEDLKRLNQEYTALQTKLKAQDLAVKEVDKFLEEKHKLDSELSIIKSLSKERLKNVKSLDALQGIIPPKAWLDHLKINDKRVELTGYAMDEFVISEFMQGMSTSIYFSNVSLVTSEEVKKNEGTVKKFILKSTLENM